MKIQFVLTCFAIAFLSCHQNNAKNNDDIIVGDWSNCHNISVQSNGLETETSYNVCPIIVFVKNHSGYIKRGNTHAVPFTWRIDEGKLIIKHTENTIDDIIDDGSYQVILSNKKSYHEMSLLNTTKNVKYILGK